MFNKQRKPARFGVTYQIGERSYWFAIPAVSAAAIWQSWDRPGAELINVEEI